MKKLITFFSLVFLYMMFIPIISPDSVMGTYNKIIAQTKDQCTEQLNQAESNYQAGKWTEAIDLIDQCLKKPNVSETEKGRAYRILGLVYIAIQLEKEANEAVKNLLIMVPNYKIDPDRDPPSLQRIIDDMSKTLNPRISGLSPNAVTEGSDGFPLTVTGSNFVYGSVVKFNGVQKATTYVSATELKADISAEDIISAGEFDVTVFSPIMNGKTSNTEKLEVQKGSKFPWTWIAIGGGAVVAAVVAILALGGSDEETPPESTLADPPARP